VNIGSISTVTFTIQAFVTLLVIMDPPGAVPIFLALVSDKAPKIRRKLAWQAAAVSLLVIAIFAILGDGYLITSTFLFRHFKQLADCCCCSFPSSY
jgi:small neutral amino acid transporter SnatA (MarC family)